MEPPPLPRRAFLVATTEIPPFTELTWSYGVHYPRPWLSRPPPSARGKRVREVNSDDDSPKPPSLPKFQKCNKWNKTQRDMVVGDIFLVIEPMHSALTGH